MNIDGNCIVSITEANQNSPEYRLTNLEQAPGLDLTEDEASYTAADRTIGVDGNNALHSFAYADGAYHLMGCMHSAASCNKWWVEDILKNGNFVLEQGGMDHKGWEPTMSTSCPASWGSAPRTTTLTQGAHS